jgi:RTX calcium-binding nonapeptide repeat (4 copies)
MRMLRLISVVGLFIWAAAFVSPASAGNVAFFTSASISVVGPAVPPTPLPLGATAAFSIPSFAQATLTVTGVAVAGAAGVTADMIDEDPFFDDVLDSHGAPAGAGGVFTITFHLECRAPFNILWGGWFGEARTSSGEQTAEIAVEDGRQHIPVGTTWSIACDKDKLETDVTAGTFELPWGDDVARLVLPPGALPHPVDLVLKNALPIPAPAAVPSGMLPISEALEIRPDVQLRRPATATLPYTQGEVEGYRESALAIFRFDAETGRWIQMESQLDTSANTLRFEIGRFGVYGFSAPPTARPTCMGRPATMIGTRLGETFRGTPRADVILGLGGDDTVLGRGGRDVLCGGSGDDVIRGGADADRLNGQSGNDLVDGGAGPDVLFGGAGRDVLRGRRGSDRGSGGPGRDVCGGVERESSC